MERRAQASGNFVLCSFPFPWASQLCLEGLVGCKGVIKVGGQNMTYLSNASVLLSDLKQGKVREGVKSIIFVERRMVIL